MNQAQSRRLRTRYLLSFLALLMASAPQAALATSTTTGLELGVPTYPVQAGIPIAVTVTARNALEVDTAYAGTIRFTSTSPLALLPPNYTFNPTVDHGTKTFPITLQSLGQWEVLVQDINTPAFYAKAPSVTVIPGPAVGFAIVLDPPVPPVVAGVRYTFQVIPYDGAGNRTSYNGPVHFETTVARALYQADFDGPVDQQQFPITFLTADPNAKTLTVSIPNQNVTGSTSFVVKPNLFHHVELSSTAPNPAPACGEVTIEMTAKDYLGNPVSEVPTTTSNTVTVCQQPGRSASFVSTTLPQPEYSGGCVTGTLVTSAQVVWKDPLEEDVDFTVSGPPQPPLTIHWRAGLPSPLTSNFSFRDSTEATPSLRLHGEPIAVQFTLRDLCGQPAALPAGKVLSFAADPPLLLTAPVQESPGRWTASASLPECPAGPPKPLAVWPLIDKESLTRPNGDRVQRIVLPQCLGIVQLALLSPAESLAAEPGAMVQFEVKVSSDDDTPLLNGVLMLEPAGLTVLGASSNGQALEPQGAGFVLPELHKGSPLTVKITAQAMVQLNQPVKTSMWVAQPNGAMLTEKQDVDFSQAGPGVDVGCGCHAAGLPSQLFPWLALLLAASRPWERLRRLRRGERIDP